MKTTNLIISSIEEAQKAFDLLADLGPRWISHKRPKIDSFPIYIHIENNIITQSHYKDPNLSWINISKFKKETDKELDNFNFRKAYDCFRAFFLHMDYRKPFSINDVILFGIHFRPQHKPVNRNTVYYYLILLHSLGIIDRQKNGIYTVIETKPLYENSTQLRRAYDCHL